MKNCIIALMCLLLASPVFAFGSYKKLDFLNGESVPQTNKILYEYVLKEQNMTPEEIKDFARIKPQSVKAFEVDLNDDGTKEILGVVYSTLYMGTARYSLFILQLQDGEYKNLAYLLNLEPQKGLKILNAKTNGYKDIKLNGSLAYKFNRLLRSTETGTTKLITKRKV